MNSRITDNSEQIDRKTSRSICDAVGERLQQSLRPDTSRLSSHLEHLMDELRRRDERGPLQVVELANAVSAYAWPQRRNFAHKRGCVWRRLR